MAIAIAGAAGMVAVSAWQKRPGSIGIW